MFLCPIAKENLIKEQRIIFVEYMTVTGAYYLLEREVVPKENNPLLLEKTFLPEIKHFGFSNQPDGGMYPAIFYFECKFSRCFLIWLIKQIYNFNSFSLQSRTNNISSWVSKSRVVMLLLRSLSLSPIKSSTFKFSALAILLNVFNEGTLFPLSTWPT